eukprot:TRINITY_DN13720_c0_g1_i4.p3 TRINITY_DN13720_c0_g1~~TRINITY_DN13720_c0_g1_i4.p3  ORF type:complete len:124 (-),score=39.24 TRINITY_DN13720_c0_g1_i4:179-550(-)
MSSVWCAILAVQSSCEGLFYFFFFFSSRRRHTRCREVSWARRCVQETAFKKPEEAASVEITEKTEVHCGSQVESDMPVSESSESKAFSKISFSQVFSDKSTEEIAKAKTQEQPIVYELSLIHI